jgi:hypothetical protein
MDLGDLNDYLNKHLLFEFTNFYQNSVYYTKENFREFNSKMHDSFNHEDLIWNTFGKPKSTSHVVLKPEPSIQAKPEVIVLVSKSPVRSSTPIKEVKIARELPPKSPVKENQKSLLRTSNESVNFL